MPSDPNKTAPPQRRSSLSVFRRSTLSSTNSAHTDGIASEYGNMTEAAADDKSILKDFRDHIKKKVGIIPDVSSLPGVIDAIRNTDGMDDRKFLLEHVLTFLSQLPDSKFSRGLANKTVELLYNDLPHPPATLVSDKHRYRTADGANNNIDDPEIGRAGLPYSRSVQQATSLQRHELPDTGLIFDTLLRRDGFVEHPAGLSSLMFSFAALVIHSVFRSRHEDVNINDTSSYVDLAPLYGANQEEQDTIRDKSKGLGLMYPDTFAESRLLLLPPAVSILLILFNRNHNYIAKKLLEINERGTWFDPRTLEGDKARLATQDEEIFQTARLINCGWFGSVVFADYFSAILGLVRTGSSWSLNPFGEIRKDDHSVFERGKGNSCSVEFNLLYRWHATTSKEDEAWVAELTKKIFGNKDPEDIGREDFVNAFSRMHSIENDVNHWTLGNITRQEDGTFPDEALANVLQNSTEHPAAAFRARGTPAVMRPHEIMGMEQARRWGVCSLNDFRKFLGLKTFDSFLEWNSDPEIADAAEKLYGGDINQLELYPGLQAEEAKPVMEGAGLCPGFTISRAILSDAIALTRGDRHFTHDYTPHNLTEWGFQDCQRDPNAHGFGSVLGRLFLRTLPNNYNEKSVYTFFPLMRPDAMKVHLKEMDVTGKYDLARPQPKREYVVLKDHQTVTTILKNPDFQAPYATRAKRVLSGAGFFTVESANEQKKVSAALGDSPDVVENISKYFYDKTRELIDQNSYTLVGGHRKAVDIVQDVLVSVPIYFAAEELAGIQLKTKQNPDGVYTPKELQVKLGDIFSYIFLDVEASKVMVLEGKVIEHVNELLDHIKDHLNVTFTQRLSISGIFDTLSSLWKTKPQAKEHHAIVEKLYHISNSTNKTANNILALMVGLSMELSLTLTNTLNIYLGSEYEADLRASAKAPASASPFDKFIWEALRLDPPFRSIRRVASKDQTIGSTTLKTGDTVFLDIAAAHLDEKVYPHASKIDLTRPRSSHVKADSVLVWIGEDISLKVMNEILSAVFSYENIRRGPGKSGTLNRFVDSDRRDLSYAYLDKQHETSPWPTSLVVQYDTGVKQASGGSSSQSY